MTWLVLTCPVQLPGQKEQVVKRRFNFDYVVVYEPNAMGTSIITLGASGVQQVTESVNQIDSALVDENSPLRGKTAPASTGVPMTLGLGSLFGLGALGL
jgi:hypothetical protein